ncbi:MAG: hypothetical protein RL385_1590 [Pseudomonadota bacterium]|jgi:hypothetical protein
MRDFTRIEPWGAAYLAVGTALSGCHYNLDELYVTVPDAAVEEDAGDPPAPATGELIDAFASYDLSDKCLACAVSKCSVAGEACSADPTCSAFTKCVGAEDSPAVREECRKNNWEWVSEGGKLATRDIGGPYAACVFQQQCASECGSHADLSCLGNYAWPFSSEVQLRYRLRFVDTNNLAVAGLKVKVCDGADPLRCSSPSASTADADGVVNLMLPVSATGAFSGYFEVALDDPSPQVAIAPALVRLGWPVSQSGATSITVVRAQTFSLLSLFAEGNPDAAPVDDTRGMMQIRVTGCSGWALGGVSAGVAGQADDPIIKTWYAEDLDASLLPSFSKTSTSNLGAAGVINIPQGTAQLSLKDENGMLVAASTVPIRPDFMTYVLVVPKAR